MRAIFAVDGPADVAPRALLPGDLAPVDDVPRTRATTRVGLSPSGPFLAIADALEASHALRELFVAALQPRCAKTYRRVRFTLMLTLVPLALLVELDRELWIVGSRGAGVRALVEVVVLGIVAADFAGRAPRHPKTTVAVLLASATRYAMLVAKPCGAAAPAFWLSGIVALGGAVAVLALAPGPARVVKETLGLLAIPEADVRATRVRAPPSLAYVASAFGVAAGLPIVLALAMWADVALILRAAVFVAYAGLVPTAVERFFEPHPRRATLDLARVPAAVALGFALTLGVTDVARHSMDAATYAQRCVDPARYESSMTKRFLDAQNREVSRTQPEQGSPWALLMLNVLVAPLAEERVYRSLLQRVLVARIGKPAGLVGAAATFGLAHLGVYRVATYQTMLLGAAFGVAYGEGGLLAAAAVHALWNLRLSV
jgi:membrane protease YdiL (CAAX protease family)